MLPCAESLANTDASNAVCGSAAKQIRESFRSPQTGAKFNKSNCLNTAAANSNICANKIIEKAVFNDDNGLIQIIDSIKAEISISAQLLRNDHGSLSNRVQNAVTLGKVFSIHGYFPALQDVLLKRGWVQKLLPNQLIELTQASFARAENAMKNFGIIEVNKHLTNAKPNFIWAYSTFNKSKHLEKYPPYYSRLISRPLHADFTRKVGLTHIYSRLYWYELNSPFEFIYPRCYLVTTMPEKKYFLDDFRLTYCTSFLNYLCHLENMAHVFCHYGGVTSDSIDFAIAQIQAAVAQKNHEDVMMRGSSQIFLTHSQAFQRVVQNGVKIRIIDNRTPLQYVRDIKCIIEEALCYFPHIARDGFCNLWIVKPIGLESGCGYGINVFNDEIKLLSYIKDDKYLVQKYIEYPLLIYNTKFDIRQYFMITMDSTNVNVWMYRNCYLKFSSQEFSLSNLSRAIHVTNHTVQKNYTNGKRSPELPRHNMWVLREFKKYLEKIDKASVWDTQLYPGMVHIIRTVINASLDEMEHATNNFQLFGADFMITDDFKPILIEVNASPDLSYSTVSTKSVCSAVIRDMVKVVLDYPFCSGSCTGDFERVWCVNVVQKRFSNPNNLFVNGKSIAKNKFSHANRWQAIINRRTHNLCSDDCPLKYDDDTDSPQNSEVDSMQDFDMEKSIKRRRSKHKTKKSRKSRSLSKIETSKSVGNHAPKLNPKCSEAEEKPWCYEEVKHDLLKFAFRKVSSKEKKDKKKSSPVERNLAKSKVSFHKSLPSISENPFLADNRISRICRNGNFKSVMKSDESNICSKDKTLTKDSAQSSVQEIQPFSIPIQELKRTAMKFR